MKEILMILALQLIYVPTFTLRTIMLVKGYTLNASFLGFVEAAVYVFGLSLVFSGDQNFISMLVYALGFGLGILIGSKIEQELAIGYTSIQVNTLQKNEELISQLRFEGYGVTVFEGHGRDSIRYKMEILTKRNQEEGLFELIEEYEPQAFIISYEPRKFQGGFLLKAMKKRRRKRKKLKENATL
ncbi:DUF2179 domain-containing protein [Scopulibacillus darangshiensis]|nr:DUF2179 domain-containing protein [Scopulibacillus darangshiensis]